MKGIMTCVSKGDPIESAIAEAVSLYQQRYGRLPAVVVINSDNPASVEAPEGVELDFADNVLPGHAWAGEV
jgi:hypothetical protein